MNKDNDEFASRLREGAEQQAMDFSDELHTRVMAAVRREKTRAPSPISRWRLLFVPIGSGVAVIVCVVLSLKLSSNPPASVSRVELPTIPSLDQVIRETADPVRHKLKDARFAYLDRDGKRLGRFLARSVPLPVQIGIKKEFDSSS